MNTEGGHTMKLMTGNKVYDVMIIEVRRRRNAKRQESNGVPEAVNVSAFIGRGQGREPHSVGHDTQMC